jgi:hypothetical protein
MLLPESFSGQESKRNIILILFIFIPRKTYASYDQGGLGIRDMGLIHQSLIINST